MATSTAPANGASSAQGAQAAPALLPFRGGTQPTLTSDGYSQTVTLGAAAQQLPPYTPSPNNLLRAIWVDVTATYTSNAAAVAFQADGPFNVLQSVTFVDANQKPIVGPLTGYDLMLINKYGGYDNNGDPRAAATYSAATGASATGFHFTLRVPIEAVIRNGLGSLQNQSSNSTFQLQITVNAESGVYSTDPTNAPSVAVSCFEDGYWKGGNAQYSGTPKAAGSTQYWTKGTYAGLNGATQIQLSQGLGYPIRNIIEEWYATGGARATAAVPTSMQYVFKGSNWKNATLSVLQTMMSRQFGLSATSLDVANGLDTGVLCFPFTLDFDNTPGAEAGLNYLQTDVGDLFQLIATVPESAQLNHLVNYIAPVGPASVLQAKSS